MKRELKRGKKMNKWIITGFALGAFLLPSVAGAQPASVGFWVAGAAIDTAADVGIPTGPSRSTNGDLCLGAGSCPSACPKPVQNFVFVNTGGGGASRLTNIVMSEEVQPGSKCRQFTASGFCAVADPDNPGAVINWFKFVATVCD